MLVKCTLNLCLKACLYCLLAGSQTILGTLTLLTRHGRLGWENALAMLPYNDRFRTYRKSLARIIGTKSLTSQYDALQEVEVGHLLLRILAQPENLIQHIKL